MCEQHEQEIIELKARVQQGAELYADLEGYNSELRAEIAILERNLAELEQARGKPKIVSLSVQARCWLNFEKAIMLDRVRDEDEPWARENGYLPFDEIVRLLRTTAPPNSA